MTHWFFALLFNVLCVKDAAFSLASLVKGGNASIGLTVVLHNGGPVTERY